jgi:VWFA-related protein
VGLSVCGVLWCVAAPQQAPPPAKPAGQAQAPKEAEPQPAEPVDVPATFRAQTTEVNVPVTVTDDQGKFISNLTKDDFRILDEGRPQLIRYFNHTMQQPMVVGFLVDLSNSTKTHWVTYQDAIRELIWALLPGDQKYSGYLISYGTDAALEVDTTTDGDKLAERVAKLRPGGGSALYDAIYLACTRRIVVKGEPLDPRRVIIVIGDGHNNSSSRNLGEVLELAKREQVTIYGMSTVAYGTDDPAEDTLEKMAMETGGRVEYPLGAGVYKDISGYISKPMDAGNYVYEAGTGGYAGAVSRSVIDSVAKIQGNISTQYILRYSPDLDPGVSDKVFRRIKVEVPSLPGVKVYARDGYYPNAVPGAPPNPPTPAVQQPVK